MSDTAMYEDIFWEYIKKHGASNLVVSNFTPTKRDIHCVMVSASRLLTLNVCDLKRVAVNL